MKGIGMETRKQKYEAPEVEVYIFGGEDVVCTSDPNQDDFFDDDLPM